MGAGRERNQPRRGKNLAAPVSSSRSGDAVFLPAHGRTRRGLRELDAGEGKFYPRGEGRYERHVDGKEAV